MAHTTDLPSGGHAIHNGDFGESITFVIDGNELEIPTQDVKHIVAEMIRAHRIEFIERMADKDLIFGQQLT